MVVKEQSDKIAIENQTNPILQLRKDLHLSQNQFAEKTGLSQSTISNMKNGKL